MLPEMDDPQAIALESAVQDFRNTHEAALFDKGHVEHDRRTRELTELYSKKHGAEPNQFDPIAGQDRPRTDLDTVMEDAMRPLSPEEYEIGPDTNFGLNVPPEAGWDHELEAEGRETMARAGLNGAEAQLVATSYAETLTVFFDPDEGSRDSTEALRLQYGDGNVDKVLANTNRMLRAVAGEKMYRWIGSSGVGSNPRFVMAAVEYARRRGYF
jgi:hypothetical protein